MCQYMMKVCSLDDQRFVQQCEHGTVFLSWFHCTWHLMPEDFLALHELLRRGAGEEGCFVLNKGDEKNLLWCGDACLMLRNEAMEAFSELVSQAAGLIERDALSAYRKATQRRVQEKVPALARLLN